MFPRDHKSIKNLRQLCFLSQGKSWRRDREKFVFKTNRWVAVNLISFLVSLSLFLNNNSLFSMGKFFVFVCSLTFKNYFPLVVVHTRCEGNKKPILWESFYNPMISLKSGRVLSHLIEILCEKLFQVPLHPRPTFPKIPKFAFGAGWEGRGRMVLRPLAVPRGLIPFPCSFLSDRFITQTYSALF